MTNRDGRRGDRRPPLLEELLSRAIDLAERGRYTVAPNPMVGAVIARGGKVVGEGWHERAGGPHAEIAAIARAGRLARGGDLYLTLEPCVHQGATPPCAPAVVASGVSRVLVGSRDENPLVRGRGVRALSAAGIEVLEASGDLRRRAERQNEKFRLWITLGRPFVLAKWASTLDGRIADASGRSRWITGEAARRRALLLREEYDAILVGAATVLADDPLLTRRLGLAGRRPHRRIVLDGRLRVPASARLFSAPDDVVVVTGAAAGDARVRRLARRGIAVWSMPAARRSRRLAGEIDLPRLLARLAKERIASLLVEGGGETHWKFLRAGLVDRVAAFTAPRILGGTGAPGAVGGEGFRLDRALEILDAEVERLGRDWLVTGRVRRGPKTSGR